MATIKSRKITKIVREFVKQDASYDITGVDLGLAKYLWRVSRDAFQDLAAGDYRIDQSNGKQTLVILNAELLAQAEAFQVGYVLDFTASEYDTEWNVDINQLKEKYNTLVQNTQSLWEYVRLTGFIADDTTINLILPQLDDNQFWFYQDGKYKAYDVSDFRQLGESLIEAYAEYQKSVIELMVRNARENIQNNVDNGAASIQNLLNSLNLSVENFTGDKKLELQKIINDFRKELEVVSVGNANTVQGYVPTNFDRVENTIKDLQNSKKYKIGDVLGVLGYYTAGDGAGHKRRIEATDDGSGVQLANGLWANIVHSGEVNVSWFGNEYKKFFEYNVGTLFIDKNIFVDTDAVTVFNVSAKDIRGNKTIIKLTNGAEFYFNKDTVIRDLLFTGNLKYGFANATYQPGANVLEMYNSNIEVGDKLWSSACIGNQGYSEYRTVVAVSGSTITLNTGIRNLCEKGICLMSASFGQPSLVSVSNSGGKTLFENCSFSYCSGSYQVWQGLGDIYFENCDFSYMTMDAVHCSANMYFNNCRVNNSLDVAKQFIAIENKNPVNEITIKISNSFIKKGNADADIFAWDFNNKLNLILNNCIFDGENTMEVKKHTPNSHWSQDSLVSYQPKDDVNSSAKVRITNCSYVNYNRSIIGTVLRATGIFTADILIDSTKFDNCLALYRIGNVTHNIKCIISNSSFIDREGSFDRRYYSIAAIENNNGYVKVVNSSCINLDTKKTRVRLIELINTYIENCIFEACVYNNSNIPPLNATDGNIFPKTSIEHSVKYIGSETTTFTYSIYIKENATKTIKIAELGVGKSIKNLAIRVFNNKIYGGDVSVYGNIYYIADNNTFVYEGPLMNKMTVSISDNIITITNLLSKPISFTGEFTVKNSEFEGNVYLELPKTVGIDKMLIENIYEDFEEYSEALNINPLTRPNEPQPSEALLKFKEKYLG